ncbi:MULTISPECIES: ATP-binding protein [Saccharothrix]|uniref:ATP-binding protein n=1 Tax=Saccharothrix TaxID=2071 RepID=UPI00093F5A8C|nr:LuxR C-terminal-related transcriptional regulator [Saccharothrix sp. CB00851]OKI26387.1 hypothetical protein A6A25_32400 [Saccharothrix sp. CB00851]
MGSVPRRTGGRLPAEMTSFVGRRHELAEVRRALGDGRLVTLTGMGGVGKTRLALRAAAGLGQAFPDGVRLVELGEVRDPEAVVGEVASVFGLDTDARQPWAALTSVLADRRVLLVLDNCEHLLDACAVAADRLSSASGGLRILATSRQPLGIPGERVLTVAPLAIPASAGPLTPDMLGQYDGVTLFLDRANATVPGFTATEDNCGLVVALCRRLDGIPLAIELAAARLRAFSLGQVLDRLTDRYALLTTGNRSAPRRQRTLQALIEWSYHLCTPRERAVWARLSVFAGGFDLAAAEAVAAEGDVADLVAGLVEKSVVGRAEVDGRTRFRMLETIRRYGHDRLVETGERAAVVRRHRDWFTRLAAEAEAGWAGPEHFTWYRRVHAERPNLRLALDSWLDEEGERQAALDLVASLCAHRRVCSSLGEGRRWLDRALARAPEPTPARAKALWVSAWLALLQGDCPAARVLLHECREIARHVDDASALAHVSQFSALADLFEGDFAGAIAGFRDAIRRHQEVGDVNGVRFSTLQQIMALSFAGDPAAAEEIRRVKALLRTAPSLVVYGYLSWCEAVERFVRRDRDRAAEAAFPALRIAADTGERWLVALCLETLAWIAADAGGHERAARVLGAAESLRQAIGSDLSGLAYLRAHHDACERAARSALGDERFEAAYRVGVTMKEDQVVSYAVPEPREGGATRRDASPLTPREREVADLVARGLGNQQIAESLVVARRTAETHVANIMTKLGFTTRAQIAAWVAERPGVRT